MSFRSKRSLFRGLLAGCLCTLSPHLVAGEELIPVDWGNYDQEGYGGCSSSYLVGDIASSGVSEYRNFFIFDLSSVEGVIDFAVLRVYNPGLATDGYDGYISPDPTETWVVYDVVSDLTDLCEGGSGLTDFFADLGSGSYYGSRVVSAADNGTDVELTLVTDALLAMEAADGLFGLGGALTSLSGNPIQALFAYSFSAPSVVLHLDIEIFGDGFESGNWSHWSVT